MTTFKSDLSFFHSLVEPNATLTSVFNCSAVDSLLMPFGLAAFFCARDSRKPQRMHILHSACILFFPSHCDLSRISTTPFFPLKPDPPVEYSSSCTSIESGRRLVSLDTRKAHLILGSSLRLFCRNATLSSILGYPWLSG